MRPIDLDAGRPFIEQHHEGGRASNTAVAVHGLFRWGQGELLGVAHSLPPTKPAGQSVSADRRNVPLLSRLVIAPEVPKNAATSIQIGSILLLRPYWPAPKFASTKPLSNAQFRPFVEGDTTFLKACLRRVSFREAASLIKIRVRHRSVEKLTPNP